MTSNFGSACIAGAFVGLCSLVVGLSAQTPPDQKAVPKVKGVASVPIVSVEGKDNFEAYCAVCHGSDAKGHGPAAAAMKVPVPDLTTIAQRKGKFDALAVEQTVRGAGKTSTPAHGVETMPIWGDVFRNEDRGASMLRIGNLVKYVQSLQVDPGKGSTPK